MNGTIRLGLVSGILGLLSLTFSTAPYAATGAKAGAKGGADPFVEAAAADAKRKEEFVKTGRRVAEFCSNCHGDNGTSKMADVPNLAGQNVNYLIEQYRRYIAGERTDHSTFKVRLLKMLKPEEKAAAAYFYGQAKPVPARAVPGPNAARGKAVYLSRCDQCHGDEGAGAETIPLLAGQQPDYLRNSIMRYKALAASRQFPPMVAAKRGLSQADIEALIDYISSMRQ